MRVVAGSAKGVRLAPVPRGVRPVSDMAREGVFSSLAAEIPGAAVLDLYAGTGAMAIEALSRGADHATLVERSAVAVRTIRENLRRTRLEGSARVVAAPVRAFLEREPGRFGLVFADPPYAAPVGEVEAVLAALSAGRLSEGATVVLTRPDEASTPVIPVDWALARRLAYGDTLVLILQEA